MDGYVAASKSLNSLVNIDKQTTPREGGGAAMQHRHHCPFPDGWEDTTPLPRPLPATARKWKFARHFLPTAGVGRIGPPLAAPRAPPRRKVSPACRRVARRRRGDALRSWNFAFVHSRLLVGRARSGKHVSRVTRSTTSAQHVRFRWQVAAWPRDGKAPPASARLRSLAGAVCPASACALGNRSASRMPCVCYATTTRAPPAGICTESASSNGKEEFSLISNLAVELAPGLNVRGIRIYGPKKATIWRSRLVAAGVAEDIWRKILTGRLRVLRFALRRRRSVAGAPGPGAHRLLRTAARAPSACPARAPARRRQLRPSRQRVPLTLRRTPSRLLRRYQNQKLFPTGSGKKLLPNFS